MEDILENDTSGYVVLIENDKKTLLMPKYYEYLIEKMTENLVNKDPEFALELKTYNKKRGKMYVAVYEE